MNLTIRQKNNFSIIDLNGSLDIYTSVELKDFIEKNINSGNNQVIINMEKLNYIDSSGIGMLIKQMNYLQDGNGELYLTCMKPQIEKVLKVSGLTTFFKTIGEDEFKTKYS